MDISLTVLARDSMLRALYAIARPSARQCVTRVYHYNNKKAQLSLANPRDAKACQNLLRFDVLTTLSLTILTYLHSFS